MSSPEIQKTATFDILIIGGGLTGLAMANALESLGGFRLGLVDPKPLNALKAHKQTPAEDQRAIALSSSSARMLKHLGMGELLTQEAQPILGMSISDSEEGTDLLHMPCLSFDTAGAAGGSPAAFVLPQNALLRALSEILEPARSSVTVLAERKPIAIARGRNRLQVTLDNQQIVHTSLLIIADGAASPTRSLLEFQIHRWETGQTALTGTLALERPHEGIALQNFLPNGPCALLPLRGRFASLVCTEKTEKAQEILSMSGKELEETLLRYAGLAFGTLTPCGPLQSWPLAFQIASDFIGPRVALVGDAAHVTHPLTGQGFNLALRDVAALTETLAHYTKIGLDPGAQILLEEYQQWRRFDSLTTLASAGILHLLFSDTHELIRPFRQMGMSALDRLPSLKHLLIQEAAGETGRLPHLMQEGG